MGKVQAITEIRRKDGRGKVVRVKVREGRTIDRYMERFGGGRGGWEVVILRLFVYE